MRKSIYILMVLFLILSCKKDKLEGEKAILVGKWKWVYSDVTVSYCNPPSYEILINPNTEGENYSIEFKENGKVIFFKDGTITEKKRIVFDRWETGSYPTFSINQESWRFVIDLNDNNRESIFGEINQDTILLFPFYFPFDDSEGCEYHKSYFVRE